MIIFCTNNVKFLFSHRAEIVHEAVRAYGEVIVFAPKSEDYDYRNHSKISFVYSRQGNSVISLLVDAFTFFMLARKRRGAVVHIITLRSILYAGLVSRMLYLKTVIAISGLGSVFSSKSYIYRLLRLCVIPCLRFIYNNRLIHFIFQNDHDKELFQSYKFLPHLANYSVLNGSGVDLGEYERCELPDKDPLRVLFASRLLKDKGIYDFVGASKILERSHQSIRFYIAGSCDLNNPNSLTRKEVDDISQLPNVEYLGEVSDMPSLLSSIHLVVLPSFYGEGMPKVLLEAAACGRPAITTDHPGCRETVIHNHTGILVPIKSPARIAESIMEIIDNEQRLEEMSRNTRSYAFANFDVKDIVSKHLEIYDELMRRDQS